jgi:hypothetical protein
MMLLNRVDDVVRMRCTGMCIARTIVNLGNVLPNFAEGMIPEQTISRSDNIIHLKTQIALWNQKLTIIIRFVLPFFASSMIMRIDPKESYP